LIHTALARKYRPNRFSELVGQEHIASGLTGAVANNRVAHAYLLTGPRGVGKTTAARILAMSLNCALRSEESGEPCGECESCSGIWSGHANLDVVEIDAASNRGVDDARDLRERAMYAASSADNHKVYIVDEAHMLTREAWNALLKILEEPPPNVVFVFATTEPHKIANTAAPVMSRLQRFDFKSIGPRSIEGRLRYVIDAEGLEADPAAIELLARSAEGGMRDALSALDQVVAFGEGTLTVERTRDALGLISDELYQQLLQIVIERRHSDVFPFVASLADSGADLNEFVKGAGELLRSLLNGLLGGEPEIFRGAIKTVVEDGQLAAGDVLRMVRLLAAAEGNIRRSANARLHVEALVLQWTLLDRTVQLDELLAGLSGAPMAPQPEGTRRQVPSRTVSDAPVRKPAQTPVSSPPAEAAPKRDGKSLKLDELMSHWGSVLDAVGASSRMLREALAQATPVKLEAGFLELSTAEQGVQLDGLKRGQEAICDAIERVTGARVSAKFVTSSGSGPEPVVAEPPARLDEASDKEKRLKNYRQKDPTLDAAVEALGLELLD
jgi:DNA polymerase-3 subunit gamma/tau